MSYEPAKPVKEKANFYFGPEVEDAIVEYNTNASDKERNRIYQDRIHPAFVRLVEAVYNSNRYYLGDANPTDTQQQALTQMVMNLGRYEKSKGKAFGYFSVVAKYFFMGQRIKVKKERERLVYAYDTEDNDGETTLTELFVVDPEQYHEEPESRERVEMLADRIDSIAPTLQRSDDIRTAYAMGEILRNYEGGWSSKSAITSRIRAVSNVEVNRVGVVKKAIRKILGNVSYNIIDSTRVA